MRLTRQKRFGLRLSQTERDGLARLAEAEGLSEAATLRQLLRQAIKALRVDLQSEASAADPELQPREATPCR